MDKPLEGCNIVDLDKKYYHKDLMDEIRPIITKIRGEIWWASERDKVIEIRIHHDTVGMKDIGAILNAGSARPHIIVGSTITAIHIDDDERAPRRNELKLTLMFEK